jgi:hypothetical protein
MLLLLLTSWYFLVIFWAITKKEVIGLANVLEEEERIANAIADSITPLLIPSLQLYTWRGRDLLLISVTHPIFV